MSTTKDKIKEMFLSGQTLTSCDAAKEFITADLRKIISDLRKAGFDIVDKWVKSESGKRYKEYRLRTEDEKKEEVSAATAAAVIIPAPPVIVPTPPLPPSIEIKSPELKIHKPLIQQQIPFGT